MHICKGYEQYYLERYEYSPREQPSWLLRRMSSWFFILFLSRSVSGCSYFDWVWTTGGDYVTEEVCDNRRVMGILACSHQGWMPVEIDFQSRSLPRQNIT